MRLPCSSPVIVGGGWTEEKTPAADPAPCALTVALWAGFRREESLPCLTADARQIAGTGRTGEGFASILPFSFFVP